MRRKISLPLISPLNSRISGTNALPSASGVVGAGFVGTMIVGKTVDPSSKDSRNVNCFRQTVGKTVYLVKRSGLGVLETPAAAVGSAIMVWTGLSPGTARITAYGAVSSSIYNGTTLIATNNTVTTNISSLCKSITETVVNTTPTLYLTASNNTGWFYANGGTITRISSASFPGNAALSLAGGGAHMDGYTFQMTTNGSIWNSDLNSISTWTASGYINANIYPDQGIAARRWRQYIIGFGSESMEFFYNAGNASGSPLSRVANMAQKVGAVSADAITQIGDTIFFAGSTSQGGLSVFQFDGQVTRISPPEIDAVLILAGASSIRMTTIRDFGLSFIHVYAGGTIYAYCVEEKFWFIWQSSLGFVRFAQLSTGNNQVVYGVSESVATGKTYTINPASRVYSDDSMTYSMQAQIAPVDPGDGEHVAYEEVQVIADVENTTSPLAITWSDDDYNTWHAPRTVDLSDSVPFVTRLGGTRSPRVFAVTQNANAPLRIEKLRITVKTGK